MRKVKFFIYMIALVVIGVALIALGTSTNKNLSKDPIDLYDSSVDWDDIKVGDHIEMDLPIVYDCYGSYEKDGKETARYYCLPLYNEQTGEITNFIGIDVNDSSLYSDYDRLVDATDDWLATPDLELPDVETVHVSGIVKEQTKEQYEAHEEYLDACGFSDDVIENSQYKLYISPADKGETKILIIIGVLCLLGGLGGAAISIVRKR